MFRFFFNRNSLSITVNFNNTETSSGSSLSAAVFFLPLGLRVRPPTFSKNWNSLQALMKMVEAAAERLMPSTNLPMLFSRPTRGV